jgi:Tfp pilus assembly protein PilF
MIRFRKFPKQALPGIMILWCVGTGCRSGTEAPAESARVITEMNRGVSLMGQYLYDDAVRAFEGVLQAAPELTEARINLAIARFNRNRKEDLAAASELLAGVLEKEPGNLRALYFEAIVLQHDGQAEQAVSRLEQVVRERPEDGAAWYLLALCKQRMNQPAEAEFLQAIRQRPYLYSAYYQLYQFAIRAGDEAKAAEYLGRFKVLRESPLGETIELPQYNQMGDLAMARPLPAVVVPPIVRSQYRIGAGKTVVEWSGADAASGDPLFALLAGAAVGDLDGDGRPEIIVGAGVPGRVVLLRQDATGGFVDVTASSGLEKLSNAQACAIGDFDNDDVPDLVLIEGGVPRLLRGQGDGTFSDVSAKAGIEPSSGPSRSALFLDADHDGDLDLFVCNGEANQLWNNNGDGGFTEIAGRAGVACLEGGSVLVLPGDLDRDRDLDLVVLRQDQPAKVFLNELLGQYTEADLQGLDIRGDAGGALQDFNGDGLLDLVVLGGHPRELRLFLGDGRGRFIPAEGFGGAADAIGSRGPLRGFRVSDIDLDGDLDIVGVGSAVHFLLNDGRGRFVLQAEVWKPKAGGTLAGLEVLDVTGDYVPDLVILEGGADPRVLIVPGELVPPLTAVAIQPSGIRSRDGRTRSPANGYGVTLTVRAGLREQRLLHTGQTGGANQSQLPVVFGLGGAPEADYVDFLWPDGVAQVEISLVAGQTHKVAELQRKISSCPVLFAWNGDRFEFITDFAGVGGLGYFAAPGVSAPPQVLEHVKIEPGQLRARDGVYELRVTEPMEESSYIDRLELVAIDHALHQQVFPDERLAIGGPPPTHELLVVDEPIFPVQAIGPGGRECVGGLVSVDRRYAYEPELDRRYVGFCAPHTLELDFEDGLTGLSAGDRVYLFINGFIEYPYSQTVYAASQSRVGWEPIRVDRQEPDGQWRTIVPDGGVPGGMGRTMTIELSGQLAPSTRKLRLTTNLEIYIDKVFVARAGKTESVTVRTVPLREATLRYVGFAREYSPDGREPLIFDYELRDATAPFHRLKGAYTRYGPVKELLTEFDDRYVLVGPGDEIALEFEAGVLPVMASGQTRSFVLVSHAYCKDMDLYTATPRTLAPLPFRAMSAYPYPPSEQYPDSEEHQAYLRTYNTRIID